MKKCKNTEMSIFVLSQLPVYLQLQMIFVQYISGNLVPQTHTHWPHPVKKGNPLQEDLVCYMESFFFVK